LSWSDSPAMTGRWRAKGRKSPGKHLAAFAILRAIVEEVAPGCWEADDHDGVLIGTVRTTLDEIRAFAARPDTDPACLAEICDWGKRQCHHSMGGHGRFLGLRAYTHSARRVPGR